MANWRAMEKRLSDRLCGHRVVFHHVPKCGGTSVNQALRMCYLTSYSSIRTVLPIYRAMELLYPDSAPEETTYKTSDFREQLLLMYLFADRRCISGHVRFSKKAQEKFKDTYKFITTLRNPVSLYISTYFWNATSPQSKWKIDQGIEAFLDTPRARDFGSHYADYFSGLPPRTDPTSRASIEAAKENLRKFAVVGMVEDMAGFERQLRRELGTRIRIGHQNKARVSDGARSQAVTPEIKRKIEDLCAANLEIYEFARREFAA